MAGGLVERAGIRQERAGPRRLHAIHDLPHERRVQVGIVARFAEVQLDGNDLILADRAERLHLVRKPHGVAEPLDLGEPGDRKGFLQQVLPDKREQTYFLLVCKLPRRVRRELRHPVNGSQRSPHAHRDTLNTEGKPRLPDGKAGEPPLVFRDDRVDAPERVQGPGNPIYGRQHVSASIRFSFVFPTFTVALHMAP